MSVPSPDTVIVSAPTCKPPKCQDCYTAALELVEQVYVYLATWNKICTDVPASKTRQRRLGQAFLKDPYFDGHNVVSTAQMLVSRVLPDPHGTLSSNWPWQYRMTMVACMSVAAKMHLDFGFEDSPVNIIALAFCFMTKVEQDDIRSRDRKGMDGVLRDVSAAEIFVLSKGCVYSMSTHGPLQLAEEATSTLLATGYLSTPRQAMICRNLCVFQFRAVVRRNVCLLAERRSFHLALVAVALRWMNVQADQVHPEVQRLAEEVLVCVGLLTKEELKVGGFADPYNALGTYIGKPTFELIKIGIGDTSL